MIDLDMFFRDFKSDMPEDTALAVTLGVDPEKARFVCGVLVYDDNDQQAEAVVGIFDEIGAIHSSAGVTPESVSGSFQKILPYAHIISQQIEAANHG